MKITFACLGSDVLCSGLLKAKVIPIRECSLPGIPQEMADNLCRLFCRYVFESVPFRTQRIGAKCLISKECLILKLHFN